MRVCACVCVLIHVCETLVTVMCATVDLLTSLNSFSGSADLKNQSDKFTPLFNTHTHHLLYMRCLIYGHASCVNFQNSIHSIIHFFSFSFISQNLSTQTIWNMSMIVSWPDCLLCWNLIRYGGSLGNVVKISAPHIRDDWFGHLLFLCLWEEKWISKVHFFLLLHLWPHSM